ncbi:hypothetical protein [Ktedonobacter sp. SOSP1-85]|uniref:hypothetical protein n=1 Tax=Ktedonobacter sp. SOSP1-85 TaxID=2778367 RepID=UPI001915C119|nr:hypothetical protein [Ktedonobacter sp. SOSP1-85]
MVDSGRAGKAPIGRQQSGNERGPGLLRQRGKCKKVRAAAIVSVLVAICTSGSVLLSLVGYALGGPHAYAMLMMANSLGNLIMTLV